jgi:RHS repeat-associated protein
MRLSNTIRPTEPSGVFALPCARGLWRRVSVHRRLCFETAADGSTNRLDRFTYDNYLCIARNHWHPGGTSATDRFVWDPTEPVATRPLVFYQPNASPQLYAHDGNKNVSELLSYDDGTISAHYEYASFGEVILSSGDLALINPFRFSSEYSDDVIGLVYYNYRHYEPVTGRWLQRDDVDEITLYLYCGNYVVDSFDLYGRIAYGYEVNLKQTLTGFSFYSRVSVVENDCPKETEVEIFLGAEWQPPQLRGANHVLNLFRVHIEAGFRGLLGGKARISECAGKSTATKICGRVEAFGRVEYRDWRVQEMGRRHRFTRSRFGAGADGGGTLCVDLSTGEVTVTASLNWYAYANFGWSWFNRTYDFGGSWESHEKLWGTFESLKVLPPIKESDYYGCCCEQKYGSRK